MDKWNKLVIRLLEGRTELTGDAIFEFCSGLRVEWEKEQAELRETWEREKQEENERHAKLILGEDRYNNSPCQAHPFELIAEFVKELQQANPLRNSYIQPVPDKCDRIIWKGRYYHLPTESRAEIEAICNSYESGYGHGLANDGLDLSKTPHADARLGMAYQIGYEAGQKRASKPSVPNLEQAGEQRKVERDAALWRLAVRKGLITIHSERIHDRDPRTICSWIQGHDKAADISNEAAKLNDAKEGKG